MIKNILGSDFKYEDDKMYRLHKQSKKWNCCSNNKTNKNGYINIGINKKLYYLHRLIYKYHNEDFDLTDISHNNQIDHININPLDNRIENLRAVNHSINQRNKNKSKNCSSKYIGVSWSKANSKWLSQIKINGKVKNLGHFDNEEDANECYKKKYDELMDCIAQK
jgi:hypothetical protein